MAKEARAIMNATEFKRVFKAAQTYVDGVDTNILFGCGLSDFKRVAVTTEVAGAFLRGETICLNGNFDMEAVNNIREIYRRKVILLD